MREQLRMGQIKDARALDLAYENDVDRLYHYDGDWEDKAAHYREVTLAEAEMLLNSADFTGCIVLQTRKQVVKWCKRHYDKVEDSFARKCTWDDVMRLFEEARRVGVYNR